MQIDFAELTPQDRYKLLTASVVPRPVAWVTTVDAEGVVNAAPFSFFNVFSEEPALIVLGIQHRPDRTSKDTTRNIGETGEFVVNLVTAALLDPMVATAAPYDPGAGEPGRLGLATAAAHRVTPPRLAASPAAFECRRHTAMRFGPQRELVIGEVLAMHARDGLVDAETWHVNWAGDLPIARLHANRYAFLSEEVERDVPAPRAAPEGGAE